MSRLSKWKVGLYLAGIFAAGSVSGWVVATKTLKQQAFTAPKSDEIAASLRSCLRTRLQLTEEQKVRIDTIIERSAREMQTIHRELTDRIRQAVNNRTVQIMAILNPEQQNVFEQIEKERGAFWRSKDAPRNKDGRRSAREKGATNVVSQSTNSPGIPQPALKAE